MFKKKNHQPNNQHCFPSPRPCPALQHTLNENQTTNKKPNTNLTISNFGKDVEQQAFLYTAGEMHIGTTILQNY